MKKLEDMTFEELLNHAQVLESQRDNTVFSIDREDVAYVLGGMLEVPEEVVPENVLDIAQQRMKSRFAINEETEQIASFLNAQSVDWQAEAGIYSATLNEDGSLSVYFQNIPDGEPDVVIQEKAKVETITEELIGDERESLFQTTNIFYFKRSDWENMRFE